MAELISFAVPTQSDKVLLVWELSAGPPAEALIVSGRAEGRKKGTGREPARRGTRLLVSQACALSHPRLSPRRKPLFLRGQVLRVERAGTRGTWVFSRWLEMSTHVVGLPQHSLSAVFSQFGLLYSVRVFPNAAMARPGFYAIIKFYSSRDAQKAQKACDGKPLFQTSPVKVRLSTRQKALRHRTFALNSSRCQELANYYFGFNGWSKRIIRLQELSGAEDGALTGPVQKQNLKFFCAVEVALPPYGCKSPGVGIAEEPLHQPEEEGQSSFLMKRKTAQKLAIQSALADAFQKLAIVVLESGKVAVEYRPSEESIDAESEEDLQSLIQVNCLQPGQREEECLSDFSLEEDGLNL